MIRTLTILILLFAASYVQGQSKYYISNAGNNSNSGTSAGTPWQTLAKLNALSLVPGDTVFLKRGDTWTEVLPVNQSGNSSNRIVFSAYGTGAKPIVTGFKSFVSGDWTNTGTNLWEAPISSGSTLNVVTASGKFVARARWPNFSWTAANRGYRTYSNGGSLTQIIDATLPGSPNFTGGEVVVRTKPWELDKSPISSQGSGTLNLGINLSEPTEGGNGYFVQGNIQAMDTAGEWHYTSGGTPRITFYSSGNPGSTVKASQIEDLVTINAKSYITIDNIRFEGGDRTWIYLISTSNVTIQNCDFDFAGQSGIAGAVDFFSVTPQKNLTINNNTIQHCNSNGIYLWNEPTAGNPATFSDDIIITNNTIKNCGFLPGIGLQGGDQYDGIYVKADSSYIAYNIIDSVGSSGITVLGRSFLVEKNFVQHWNMWTEDIGGIYSSHAQNSNPDLKTGVGVRTFQYNTVVNGSDATPGLWLQSGHTRALYFDEPFDHGSMLYNNVGNLNDVGIMLHRINDVTIYGNTVWNCQHASMAMWTLHNCATCNPVDTETFKGMVIKKNVFFARTASQTLMDFKQYSANNIYLWALTTASWDSNWYCRPFEPVGSWQDESTGGTGMGFQYRFWEKDAWNSLTNGYDAHSALGQPLSAWTIVTINGSNLAGSSGFSNSNYSNNITINGGITAGRKYRVKFTVQAATPSSNVRLDIFSSTLASEYHFAKLSTTSYNADMIFTANQSGGAFVEFKQYDPVHVTYTVSAVDIRDVTAIDLNPDDSLRFEYNPTGTATTLALGTAIYKDPALTSYTGNVSLAPYSSLVLTRTGTNTNLPPSVNAGADRNITLPTNSTSSSGASASDPDGTETHVWTQVSGPNTAGISAPTNTSTNFTGLIQGSYIMRLTSTDNLGAIAFDEMNIVVNAATNISPTANAGADVNITLPVHTVQLDGSASSDPDGTIVAYSWSFRAGPASYSFSPGPGVVNPILGDLVAGTYIFRLQVQDDDGATAIDDITITVTPQNIAPIANAGRDSIFALPATSFNLQGSGSYDPDGTITTYAWTKISGPSYSINNASIANPILTNLVEGTYVFRITVTDNNGASSTDEVIIAVLPVSGVMKVKGRQIKLL